MKSVFRIVSLFAAYSTIGYGGDFAAGLLGQEERGRYESIELELRESDPSVVRYDVMPDLVFDVELRHRSECSYELARELTIPIQNMEVLHIDAGAGELHVEGSRDLSEVVVVGIACASEEAWLEELTVTVSGEASGDVSLETHYPANRHSDGGDNTARIDLTILVPFGLSVDIDDSSGGITVSGTGDLHIDDSSGGIEVFDIAGDVSIDDSSAGIEIRDVAGDVSIDDGSGGIAIANVSGSVAVRDGSGGIDIARVGEDVLIESDGSGGINVAIVGGDFIVESDGNGGIDYAGVEGAVDIPEEERKRRRRPGH